MHLKVHQRKQEKSNVIIYKKAIEFFIDQLLSKKLQKHLHVSVVFKKFKGKLKDEHGQTWQTRKNAYKVEINSLKPFHHIIGTLAHESTHVAQGRSGKLIFKDLGFVWKKKFWDEKEMYRDDTIYDSAPWEVEAVKNEKILTQRFFKEILVKEVIEFDYPQ